MPLHEGLFRFSLLLLFTPLFLGALAGCFLTWTGLRRRAVLRAWPGVEVRVLSSEVERSEYRSWYFARTRSWDFIIDFEYDHAGRTWRSRVRLEADVPGGGREPDPQTLENAVAQARRRLLERLVAVRVNPDDPSETAWIEGGEGGALRARLRLAAFAASCCCALAVLIWIFTH